MKPRFIAAWGSSVLVAYCLQFARAELPPSAYPNPDNASEDVDIKVLNVSKRVTEENDILIRWDVEMKAEVREVRKTGSELQPGSHILIRYSAHSYKKPGWTGPGSQPILPKGGIWSAFLNAAGDKDDRYYVPGGAPYSTFGAPGKK